MQPIGLATSMSPITVLWGIVVTGSVLLLGLFGVCTRWAYHAVKNPPPPLEAASDYDEAD
jgi:hypothetical protein